MSLRQIKKVLEEQKKAKAEAEEDVDEEEEEEEEVKPARKVKKATNAFELLDLDEGEEEEDEDEEPAQPKASKKKKKNKKKGKKPKEQDEKKQSKGDEDIDDIVNSLNNADGSVVSKDKKGEESSANNNNSNVVEQERLFKIDPKMCDPDAEIRRVFGAKVLGNTPRTNQPRNMKKINKKIYLVKPKDEWPPMIAGVSMEPIENKPGSGPNVNYFKIAWSISYHELQQQFYECVETADPYSFQDLLMIHPYHVDSTLQLAQVCIQTGDYAMAGDLVERCLYTFESSWHHRFAPHGPTNCYMEFSVPENRSFFLAILKHIQLLGRRGSVRTALEFAKLLISLDPTDPLYMRGVLDYYCMRGKEYSFLLTLFEHAQVDNTPFSIYPNFCYSAALAKFTLEYQKSTKTSDTNENSTDSTSTTTSTTSTSSSSTSSSPPPTSTKPSGSNPYPLASSKFLLYNAMTLFPMALLPLLNKAGINYQSILRDESPTAFFSTVNENISPLLQKTITLFVDKNNTLWKAPEVVQWLKEVLTEVQRQIDGKAKEYADICTARDNVVREWNAMNERMGMVPLLLSEHADTASPLPPELFQMNNNPNHPPPHLPPPNPIPLAANPLALFIQTLMPWVNIPPPG